MNTDTTPSPVASVRAPDPIIGELWEVKREINREAEYRIEELVRMAREATERVRRQWSESEKNECGD
jgi:hypothetical protein